jgi:hypothetical protein
VVPEREDPRAALNPTTTAGLATGTAVVAFFLLLENLPPDMRNLRRLTIPVFLPVLLAACAEEGADSAVTEESSAPPGAVATAAEGEWRPLFDGATLTGWSNPYEWGAASVESGEIHLVADQKFFLMTDEEFGDFEFEGEVLMPDTMSNAGFMFRANVEGNRVFGYQAEVDPKARRWSGGLYDEGRRGWLVPAANDSAAARAFREGPGSAFRATDWNRYRIRAQGDSLKIWVNDVLTAAYSDTVDAAGPIGLQHHGEDGKVYRYRNLRIQELQ